MPNNAENILNNLCSGLETFLGFNPSSKGYNGSGIVYSDLDRLCDAVMGFLSGVLEAVKNENEVTTYDKYILRVDYKLEKLINKLKSSMGKGSTEFSTRVTEVSEWLSRYDTEVNRKINAVIQPINHMITGMGSAIQTFQDLNNHEVSQQHEWLCRVVSTFVANADESKKALKHVDGVVVNKLKTYSNLFTQAVTNFDGSVKNGDVKNILFTVTSQVEMLNEYADDVNRKAVSNVYTFFDNLTNNVINIRTKLAKINMDLGEKNLHLDTIVKDVEVTLKQAKQNQHNMSTLYGKITDDLTVNIETTRSKFDTLGILPLQSEIQRLTSEITEAVARFGEQFGTKKSLEDIVRNIKAQVGSILRGSGHGLLGLLNGIKSYVEAFTNQSIETTIREWVEDILDKKSLDPYIEWYIMDNALKLGAAGKDADAVKNAIKLQLPGFLTSAIEQATQDSGLSRTETVSNLLNNFKKFTTNVETELGKMTVDAAVTAIESDEKLQVAQLNTTKSNLQVALHMIIRRISDMIKGAANEIETFMVECQLGNLDFIVSQAETLDRNLKDDLAAQVDSTIQHVSDKVNKLNNDFENNVKTSLATAVQRLESTLDDLKEDSTALYGNHQGVHLSVIQLSRVDRYVKQVRSTIIDIRHQSTEAAAYLIDHVQNELDTTKQKVLERFRQISDDLRAKINQASEAIKQSAQVQYHTTKSKELRDLQSFVQKQMKAIEHVIYMDKRTGLKGCLRKLKKSIDDNLQISPSAVKTSDPPSKTVRGLAYKFMEFSRDYLQNLKQQEDLAEYPSAMYRLMESLDACVVCLYEKNHFDVDVSDKLQKFSKVIDEFSPETMDGAPKTVLTPLKQGFGKFVDELDKAYVSRYSGETVVWLEPNGPKTPTSMPTKDAMKCAKAFLTLIPVMCHDVSDLRSKCVVSWSELKTNLRGKNNPLGACLQDAGYKVSESETVHNGVLRNTLSGQTFNEKLKAKITDAEKLQQLKSWKTSNNRHGNGITLLDLFDYLHYCLKGYYEVCHLGTFGSKKHPRSIYDMLQWLSGLSYNPVHQELTLNGFSDLFEKPEKDEPNAELSLSDKDPDTLEAYPENVTATKLSNSLRDVCAYSETVLVAIQGYGHAGGRYACDFNSNADSFVYPADPAKCLEILADVLTRVYEQLCFLLVQCSREYEANSWRDCYYGYGVGGSSWTCNTKQCPNRIGDQTCNQTANQMVNQNGDQKDDQHPKCGLKSPLQSFLEDALQGFLPHHVSANGSKMVCSSCPKALPGTPCKTPMGFSDIGTVASHRQAGQDLRNVLHEFCGGVSAHLTMLCSLLNCVLPSAPKSLDAMFAFYYNFLNEWNTSGTEHKSKALQKAVCDANFENSDTRFDITGIFKSVTHSDSHRNGDLYSLVQCEGDSDTATHPCGAYVKPLSVDTCNTFAKKHADKYLSWIVYLTETFYKTLRKLSDECSRNCGSPNSKCHGQGCYKECLFKTGAVYVTATTHWSECKSIVNCTKTLPTICKYGLYYYSKSELNGQEGIQAKRTCEEFCRTLQNAVKENNALYMLVYRTIPQFLWTIRGKFFWTTVALWSLSLFYLICVMVGRLDVLHIRSHLRIPSSHKITAQSLLAAAQVGRLAKISYLQP